MPAHPLPFGTANAQSMKNLRPLAQFLATLAAVSSVSAENDADAMRKLAQDALNPIANMISVPIQYNANFRVGPSDKLQSVMTIQPVIPFTFDNDWLLVTRWVLPVIDQPDALGGSGSTFGLGDLAPAFFFVPPASLTGLSPEFTIGFGPGLQVPTHTDPVLGIDEWGAGPTFLVVYSKDRLQLGLLAANTWSLGDGGEALNSMLLEPWIAYNITDEWYVLSDVQITANWNAPSSERWILPVGGGVGKTFHIGKQAMNVNLQAYWNVVHPDDGPDWSMVFTFQMLFPK
jgi:hypothetical protein